jgi:hypothetical protein
VSFARVVHDWEVDVFSSFIGVLHSVRVIRGREDQLLSDSSTKGLFKVKSYFCLLVSLVGSHLPKKSIWQTQAPSRVAVFVWSTAIGKFLNLKNLRR